MSSSRRPLVDCRARLAALLLVSAAAGRAMSQEAPSSTQLGVSIGSGARALGMGGAFIAVADDATASSWNPAGLAVLQKPEASFVWKARDRQTLDRSPGTTVFRDRMLSSTSTFGGQVDSARAQGLDFVSVTYPFKLGQVRLVPQLNYQRAIELGYDRRTVKDAASATHARRLAPGGEISFEDESATSSIDDAETGGIDIWAVSVAVSPHPKLQLGISLNAWRNGSLLEESAVSESFTCVTTGAGARACTQDAHRFEGSAQQTFGGWNFNLGALLRPTAKLRVGLVYKAPFDMEITRLRSFQNDLAHRSAEGASLRLTRFTRQETGLIRWPWTLGLGLALAPREDLLLSADFTTTRWSRAEYTYAYRSETIDGNPDPDSFNAVDVYAERARVLWPTRLDGEGFPVDPTDPYRDRRQRDSYQVRAGLEYVFAWKALVLPVRAGGFVDGQYFTNTDGSRVTNAGVSVGVGIVWRNVSFDAAYLRQELRFSNDYSESSLASGVGLQELRSLRKDRIASDRLYLSTILRF